MTSALVQVGGGSVLRLCSPLIIGIRLEGTLGSLNPRNPYIIKPRPYLRYLAETLRRLHCDVTLIMSTNPGSDEWMRDQFATRDFPVPHCVVYDHDQRYSMGGGGRAQLQTQKLAANNYVQFFAHRAEALHASTERILFIDSELNYRYSPVQTLVLEAYSPVTRRQHRKQMQAQSTGLGPAQLHLQSYVEAAAAVQRSTQLVEEERQWLRDRDEGRPPGRRHGPSSSGEPRLQDTTESTWTSSSSPVLSVQQEDYSLVAVAEMLVELAGSHTTVRDYLRREPLLEKLRVPFHGEAHYLPIGNCDHMELLDWETIEVQEHAEGEEAVPERGDDEKEPEGFFR